MNKGDANTVVMNVDLRHRWAQEVRFGVAEVSDMARTGLPNAISHISVTVVSVKYAIENRVRARNALKYITS